MADVVFGDVNRVPVCPPLSRATWVSAPSTTTKRTRDVRIRMVQPILANSNYLDCIHGPLYAFGHGLGHDLRIQRRQHYQTMMTADGRVKASVTVTNTGKRDGKRWSTLCKGHLCHQFTPGEGA